MHKKSTKNFDLDARPSRRLMACGEDFEPEPLERPALPTLAPKAPPEELELRASVATRAPRPSRMRPSRLRFTEVLPERHEEVKMAWRPAAGRATICLHMFAVLFEIHVTYPIITKITYHLSYSVEFYMVYSVSKRL